MPTRRGRYSCPITIVTPKVPITQAADEGERDRSRDPADDDEDENERRRSGSS